MNIFQKLLLAKKVNGEVNQFEEAVKMKNFTKGLAAVIAILTTIIQVPQVETFLGTQLNAHPHVAACIGGLITILTLIHDPKKDTQ